jgi:hypothetical protein
MSEESLDYRRQLANVEEAKAEFNKAYEEATKTGDPVKAEELQALLEKKLSILEKALLVAEKPERITFLEAQEIMGSNFIGADEVEIALGVLNGISKDESYANKIPYSREDLEKAKKLDAVLIYRANKIGNGPVTLDYLSHLYLNMYGVALISNETEVKTIIESPIDESKLTLGWKLVTKNPIDRSGGNYYSQMVLLSRFLRDNSLALEEDLEVGKQIVDIVSSAPNPQSLLNLQKFPINLKHRRSPLESVYDWVMMSHRGEMPSLHDPELTNRLIYKNLFFHAISIRSDNPTNVIVESSNLKSVTTTLNAKTYPVW